MKKLLSLLVVSILGISGLGAVAISNDDITSASITLQPKLVARARGGFRVHLLVVNTGNDVYQGDIQGNITINSPMLIIDGSIAIPGVGVVIQPNQSVTFKSGFSLGIGLCTVTVTMDIDGDGKIDGQASKNGFILGPLVLFSGFPIPLP